MLTQTTRRIGGAADVEGFSVFGAEQVTTVEGWDRPAFDFDRVGHDSVHDRDEVVMSLLIASKSVQRPVRADGMVQMECVVIGGLGCFPTRQPCYRPHLQQFRRRGGFNSEMERPRNMIRMRDAATVTLVVSRCSMMMQTSGEDSRACVHSGK